MSITYRDGISILQLIFYLPAFFLAVWLCYRHGFRRNAGWFYLVLLSLIRIIGACAQLETISSHADGVETTAAICISIGLSPLILLCLGLLSRVYVPFPPPFSKSSTDVWYSNDSVGRNSKIAVSPLVFRLLTVLTMVGLVLCIVGINDSTSSTSKASLSAYKVDAKTKIGVILFVISWACLCLLLAAITMQLSHVDFGEKRLILAVAISIPFIFIRLCYSLLGDFTHNSHFNPLTGSVTIDLCMAVLMEFAVVVTCLTIGLTLHVVPLSALAPPVRTVQRSHRTAEPDASLENGAFNYINPRRAAGAGRIVPPIATRRELKRGPMGGGPIHTLVGMAMDRYK